MKLSCSLSLSIVYFCVFVAQLHQAQNECQRERTERCKLERLQMQHHKQVLAAAECCRHVETLNETVPSARIGDMMVIRAKA